MYFEDYTIGQSFDIPEISLSKEKIISFAKEYDPRYFHTDENLAKETRFGGIIASGLQTIVSCWAAWVKMGIDADGMICGMELTNNRWIKPVYPGDILRGRLTITAKNLRADKKTGSVSNRLGVKNQKGELVLTLETTALIKCKNAFGTV